MVAKARLHGLFVDDVYPSAEQFAQVHHQPAVVQERAAGLEADDEIEIRPSSASPRDRAENADIRCAISPGNSDHFIAAFTDVVRGDHVAILCGCGSIAIAAAVVSPVVQTPITAFSRA